MTTTTAPITAAQPAYVIAANEMTSTDGTSRYCVLTEDGLYQLDRDREVAFLTPMGLHASKLAVGDYVDGRLIVAVRHIDKADGTRVARVTFAGRKTPVTLTGPQDVWQLRRRPARWISSGDFLLVA